MEVEKIKSGEEAITKGCEGRTAALGNTDGYFNNHDILPGRRDAVSDGGCGGVL